MLSPDGVTPAEVAAYFLATGPTCSVDATHQDVYADAYTPDELVLHVLFFLEAAGGVPQTIGVASYVRIGRVV